MKRIYGFSIFHVMLLVLLLTVSNSCNTEVEPKLLPVLTTTAITKITQNTAISGGIITSDGGLEVSVRGVCWSLKPNPTINDSTTKDAAGTGEFTSNITNLIADTTYYLRAYATNSDGSAYGLQVTFKTLVSLLPVLTTTAITDITVSTATSGGNITFNGGSAVTARGVCWSTTSNPTITLSTKTSDGEGIGTFTSNIPNLLTGTNYYMRAYATNKAGTGYGTQTTFRTQSIPILTTTPTSSITATTAISGGNITSDGGAMVTARGVCWSITAIPTITDNKSSNGTGTGTFTSSITGLTVDKTYYVRAYATNAVGTAYGAEVSFTNTDVVSGNGSEATPYNVAGGIANQGASKWIKGYIVGYVVFGTPTTYIFTSDTCTVSSNLLIAGSKTETDITRCMAVQLPSGAVQTGLNLKTNKMNLGKEVTMYGSLEVYYGKPGLKTVSYYALEGGTIGGTKPVDTSNAIFSETFASSSQGAFTVENVLLPTGFTSVWLPTATYGMAATGFKVTNVASEGWLISPAINLAGKSNVTLSFEHAIGPAAQLSIDKSFFTVWISNNYTSGAPSTATWTKIDLTAFSTTAWGYVTANLTIPSASLAAKAKIAFKYMSTSSASATWEIKNVVVK